MQFSPEVKLCEDTTISEMVGLIDQEEVNIKAHRSDDFFLKKWVDGSYEPISKTEHKNLKRRLMRLLLKKCGVKLSSKEAGNVSEISFIQQISKNKKLNFLLEVFQLETNYI